jgi:hypothetical protein
MIQRIQSVWLLVAAAFTALAFKFPFYSGYKAGEPNMPLIPFKKLVASSNFLLLIFSAILLAGCLIIIFLFKDRKLQLNLTIAALALSIINLIIYFIEIKKFTSGTVSLSAIFALATPIFLFLASRGIWKDKKLVRDLDRLR